MNLDYRNISTDIGSDNTEVYDFSAQSEDLIILSAASKDSNGDDIINGLTIVGGQGADIIGGTHGEDIITIDNNDIGVVASDMDTTENDTLKITADVDMTTSGKNGIFGFESIVLDGDGADLTLTASNYYQNNITTITGFTDSGSDIEQLIISNAGGDASNINVSSITFTNADATLIAGDNGDTLIGGSGADTLTGGAGDDSIYADDTDTIDGGANTNSIWQDSAYFETAVSATNLLDNHLVNIETIAIFDIGNDNTEVYDFSAQSEDLFIAVQAGKDNSGDDITNGVTIIGGQGTDVIYGGNGNDIITIDNNDTVVYGKNGTDTLKITADVDMTASGKSGIDNFENIILDGDGADLTLTADNYNYQCNITNVTGFTDSGTNVEQLIIKNTTEYHTTINMSNITFTNAGATLIAGDNGDYLAGGNGNDSIILGNGNDIVWFADTGANNGDDTITGFDIANDKLDFSDFNTLTIDQNSGADTAIVAYTSADTSDVNIADKIVLYSDATETDIDEESEIASLIEGASDSFALNGKAVLLTGDADSSDDVMNIWYIDSSLDGTAGDVTATDVVLVGHTSTGFDLDTLTTSNLG